ncbi:MAG: hypothetical protein AB1629_01410 [Candidatus Omnitrophota bacterium]
MKKTIIMLTLIIALFITSSSYADWVERSESSCNDLEFLSEVQHEKLAQQKEEKEKLETFSSTADNETSSTSTSTASDNGSDSDSDGSGNSGGGTGSLGGSNDEDEGDGGGGTEKVGVAFEESTTAGVTTITGIGETGTDGTKDDANTGSLQGDVSNKLKVLQ